MDEKIKTLIDRIMEDGIASATVSDGHVWGFSLAKLREMVATCEKQEQEYLLVQVKNPSSVN